MSRQVSVTLIIQFVRSAKDSSAPSRYAAELIARKTQTVMYRSKVCTSGEEARALAVKYLAKNQATLLCDRGVELV